MCRHPPQNQRRKLRTSLLCLLKYMSPICLHQPINHPPFLTPRQSQQLPPRIAHTWSAFADAVDTAFLMYATDLRAFACNAYPDVVGRGTGLEQPIAAKLVE